MREALGKGSATLAITIAACFDAQGDWLETSVRFCAGPVIRMRTGSPRPAQSTGWIPPIP